MTSAGPILGVVFDLDDTLLAEREYVRGGYAAAAEHVRVLTGRSERFETWLWERFLRGQAEGAFDALNAAFALGLNGQVGELVQVYRRHAPTVQPVAGMASLLGLLHARVRLGLLSDGYLPAQRLKLAGAKLERFFDAVVFTEELGRAAWKPSLQGFELMASLLELPHRACAYVADNPAKDFVAPNRLGWRTVQIMRPGQVHAHKAPVAGGRPEVVARSIGELATALR